MSDTAPLGGTRDVDFADALGERYLSYAMSTIMARSLPDVRDEDAVDFRSTYDGEDREPIVLPARFPNLLANGAAGIAVGMATSIPPHNAGEICAALLHLIAQPKCSTAELIAHLPGPDFPTG